MPVCPFCESSTNVSDSTLLRGDGATVWCCATCHLDFVDVPIPEYNMEYFEHEGGPNRIGYGSYNDLPLLKFLWQLALVQTLVPSGNTLADVGCATGKMLRLAEAAGYTACGVEPSAYARGIAEQLGFQVYSEVAQMDRTFDGITVWDTFEHVSNPRAFLETLFSHLADDGYIMMSSPSPATRTSDWFGFHSSYEHVSYPNSAFLEHAAHCLGGYCLAFNVVDGVYSSVIGVFARSEEAIHRADHVLRCLRTGEPPDVPALWNLVLSFDKVNGHGWAPPQEQGSVLGVAAYFARNGHKDWILDVMHRLPDAPLTRLVAEDLWPWLAREMTYEFRISSSATERQREERAQELQRAQNEKTQALEELDRTTREMDKIRQQLGSVTSELEDRTAEIAALSEQRRALEEQLATTKQDMEASLSAAAAREGLANERLLEIEQTEAFRIGRVAVWPAHVAKRGVADFVRYGTRAPWTRYVWDHMPLPLRRRVKKALRRAPIAVSSGRTVPVLEGEEFQREPLISVILPVYNHADMVAQAIESVLAQSYTRLELIVVDDGSTDNIDSVRRYLQDPRVRFVRQKHAGLPAALNTGHSLAKGEYITWTSADNIMGQHNLRRLLVALERSSAIMAYSDYQIIDDRGLPLYGSDYRLHNQDADDRSIMRLPDDITALRKVHDNFIGPSFLYHRSAMLVGLYVDSMGVEDYEYWMRIALAFDIDHVDVGAPYYRYRVHLNSLSANAGSLRIVEKAQKAIQTNLRMGEAARDCVVAVPSCDIGITRDAAEALLERGMRVVREVRTAQAVSFLAVSEYSTDFPTEGDWLVYVDTIEGLRGLLGSSRTEDCTVLTRDGDIVAAAKRGGCAAVLCKPNTPLADYIVAEVVRKQLTALVAGAEVVSVERRKLRVLIQVQELSGGGLERMALTLALEMRKLGHEVTVAQTRKDGALSSVAIAHGLRVVNPRSASDYAELIRHGRYDVVNAHYCWDWMGIARELGVEVVETLHNSYVWLAEEERNDLRLLDEQVSSYVAVSADVARFSAEILRLPRTKIETIPNSIPITLGGTKTTALAEALSDLRSRHVVFACVGSLYPVKNQLGFVRALAEMISRGHNVAGVVVGGSMDQSYAQRLRRYVGEQHLEARIAVVGSVPSITDEWRDVDCLVMPSAWEGWSLAMSEAVLAGVPIISSDVGCARDLISSNGLILPMALNRTLLEKPLSTELAEFEDRSVHMLVTAFEAYLTNREHLTASAARVANAVKVFLAPSRMAREYEEHFYATVRRNTQNTDVSY